MRRRLVISYLSITSFVLVALALPLGLSYGHGQASQLQHRVENEAYAMALRADQPLALGDTPALRGFVRELAARTGDGIVVVGPAGQVLARAGSQQPPVGSMDLTDGRHGRTMTGRRATSRGDVMAATVPVLSGGGTIGAVRVSASLAVVDGAVTRNWLLLGGLAGVLGLIVLLVSTLLARSITRPLDALDDGASKLGDGDLSVRVPVPDDPPELHRLAASFNATAARLESLLSSQRAFIADASHQLRSPLAALRLRLENVEADGVEHHPEDLEGALAEVRRLTQLVESLLVLTRAEDAPAPTIDVDVAPLVDARLDAWRAVAAERGVALMAAVPSVTVRSGPGRLEQVLDNLLSNALDVAPRESAVLVVAHAAGERVELAVRDAGPGMSPEERARAFDRFWRAPTTPRSRSGFGLGLPIVHRLVLADGGSVRIEDAPEGGLAVVVSLQAAAVSALRASA